LADGTVVQEGVGTSIAINGRAIIFGIIVANGAVGDGQVAGVVDGPAESI
jgi:hypothetical protein